MNDAFDPAADPGKPFPHEKQTEDERLLANIEDIDEIGRDGQPNRGRDEVPCRFVGLQEQFMVVADGIVDQITDTAARSSMGQHLHQLLSISWQLLRKYGIDRLFSEFPVKMFVHNGPARGQTKFQSQAPGNLLEKTVQSTDPHAVQIAGEP